MKKFLPLILAFILLLSACSNDNNDTEVKKEKSMTTESIINDSVEKHKDIVSYVEYGELLINDEKEVDFIITIDNDENVKFEADSNSVFTFYDVDDEKKTVQNGELKDSDIELNALNYGEIIESLQQLPEGNLDTKDDQYVLTFSDLNAEDLTFLSEDVQTILKDNKVNDLTLELFLNENYSLIQADVSGNVVDDEKEYKFSGHVEFDHIDSDSLIELP